MQAFPWDTAPSYLRRDRDRVYGKTFRTLAADMRITEVLTAARSPWQNPYVERLVGSIRRECLDHVIVMNESSLRRQIACYLDYYHGSRSHLSLGKDWPDGRAVKPPELGRIVAVPKVGGLHPSIPTPSRLNSLPPMNLRPAGGTQLAWGCTGGATLTDRDPRPWSPDKVSPWLIVGSSTSRNGSV